MEFFMVATVNIYSNKKGELNKFLSHFYNTDLDIENELKWEKKYENPIELAEIIGIYIDNSENYMLNMRKNSYVKQLAIW